MEFVNAFTAAGGSTASRRWRPSRCCCAPLAPHLAEELWQILGHDRTLAYEPWPTYDPALLKDDEVEVPVQVNGKLRGRSIVPADADAASDRSRRPRRRADRRPARGQDDPQGRSSCRASWSTSWWDDELRELSIVLSAVVPEQRSRPWRPGSRPVSTVGLRCNLTLEQTLPSTGDQDRTGSKGRTDHYCSTYAEAKLLAPSSPDEQPRNAADEADDDGRGLRRGRDRGSREGDVGEAPVP